AAEDGERDRVDLAIPRAPQLSRARGGAVARKERAEPAGEPEIAVEDDRPHAAARAVERADDPGPGGGAVARPERVADPLRTSEQEEPPAEGEERPAARGRIREVERADRPGAARGQVGMPERRLAIPGLPGDEEQLAAGLDDVAGRLGERLLEERIDLGERPRPARRAVREQELLAAGPREGRRHQAPAESEERWRAEIGPKRIGRDEIGEPDGPRRRAVGRPQLLAVRGIPGDEEQPIPDLPGPAIRDHAVG